MTKEQETIAEQIIQKHKENDGLYDWKDFDESFNKNKTFKYLIVNALKEKNIINLHSPGTSLTETGWAFKGFENERNSITEKEIRQTKIEELTLSKLKFDQFPAKFWWLLLLISIVISILTTWVNNQIQKTGNSKEKQQSEISVKK